MAIADLKSVLKIFGGSEVSEEEHQELFKEVLLMTLARAADADINIQTVEIDRIREIVKEKTGREVSQADVRVAAREELYAEATLRKYLGTVRGKMTDQERVAIVRALVEIFRSDESISVLEVDFFNGVVGALHVSPAEVAGLSAGAVS